MHGLTPYTGGLQYVCLVHGGQLLVALHCHVKCTAANALYLGHRVVHIVPAGLAQLALAAAALTKVNITGQLTANQNIKAVTDNFRLNRASIRQSGVHLCRTQIDKQLQIGTQPQQRALRTLIRRNAVPLRAANSTQQNGIRCLAYIQRFLRQRNAILVNGVAARIALGKVEGVAKLFTDNFHCLHCFCNDFRTDTIALNNRNIVLHYLLSSLSFRLLSRPPAEMMFCRNGGNAAAWNV